MRPEIPPGPPFEFPLHPDFEKQISEFGDWLARLNHREDEELRRTNRYRLLTCILLIGSALGALIFFGLSTAISVSSIVALCSLCLIKLILDHQRTQIMMIGNIHLNIRFLASLIHKLDHEKRVETGVR